MIASNIFKRRNLLFITLAMTVASAIFININEDSDDHVIEPVKDITTTRNSTDKHNSNNFIKSQTSIELQTLPIGIRYSENHNNAFSNQSWHKKPKAPALTKTKEAPVAIEPQAPPLPFTYLGRMLDGEKITFFLSSNHKNHIIEIGDTIDGTYRINELNSTGLQITYLPLNISQTLPIGEPK